MRTKSVALFASLVVLFGATAGGCEDGKKKCEPGTIREDSYREGRWWLCGQNGRETPQDSPYEQKNPIDA